MALIGKIRKNFWFVLLLLGLALAAFVVMDMTSAGGMGGAGAQMTVGKIEGQTLSWNEFQQTEQVLYGGGGGDLYERRNTLWNYFVEKAIIENEADKLGLYVSSEELMDLQFGSNLSPIIRQNWVDPQTGQLNMQQLLQFKQAIENNQPLDPRFRQFWAEQEKQIIKTRLEDKLNTMVSKAVYTPAWLAENRYKQQNSYVDFAYVKIPFDQIDAPNLAIDDEDLKAYMEENRNQFEIEEETRQVDYAVFDVLPTSLDSAVWLTEIRDLMEEYKNTAEDSIYALNHNGFYANFYYKPSELSDSIKNRVPEMNEGEVYGPFIEGNGYRAMKLIESRLVPDSVRASHILVSATAGDANQLINARNTIDSLKNLIENRTESFDSLAIKFSNDPSSAPKGGDLGFFNQGRMVPSFNNICFITGEIGELYRVETQFGVHLLKITDRKYLTRNPKYKISFIQVPIIPTQSTQDSVLDVASELISMHPYLDDLSNEISNRNDVEMESMRGLKKNDYEFGDLGSGSTSRDIIRWAFEPSTSVNDVSPEVYIYTDPVNYFNSEYVIIGLKSIIKSGLQPVSAVRADIEQSVLNRKKGEQLISELEGKDLEEIAVENDISVDTLRQVSYNSRFIAGLGNEPKVIASAIALQAENLSEPIIGESGVFVVKLLSNLPATQASNIPQFRNLESATMRNQVNFQLMQAMKKNARIRDNRFVFY